MQGRLGDGLADYVSFEGLFGEITMDVEIIPNDSTRNEKKKSQKKKRKVEDGISKSNNSEMDNTLALMEITKTTTQSDSAPTSDEGSRIKTSIFDYCVENHFKAMDLIDKLCSENGYDFLDDTEIQRLAPSITFLSEWRYFMYKSRLIRFAFEMGHPNETQAPNEITLPQFSAALVPNCDMEERFFIIRRWTCLVTGLVSQNRPSDKG